MPSPCPPQEVLIRFARGEPSPEEADSAGPLAVHLEECTRCRDILEQLARLTDGGLGPVETLTTVPVVRGYEIVEEIGRGGAGVVFKARQESPSRLVALKFLPGGVLAGPSRRERAVREASAAVRVRHPNVVPVHDVGEADRAPYLVMDLIEGGSLARFLRDGLLAAKDAAFLIELVAGAVGHMHRRGVLHLDLKPANILLDGPPGASIDRYVPLVADFGIARLLDEAGVTAPGTAWMSGTPGYMAPEQAGRSGQDVRVDERADIYALGAILYHALTGRPPFQAATALETIALVRESRPVAPSRFLPGLNRDLEAVVMMCLAESPERRYATADDLADDLRRWRGGFPVKARPVSKADHAWRWCRRHPAVASLATALTLTVLGGITLLLLLLRHAAAESGRAEVEHALARVEHEREAESRRRSDQYEQFSARAADELTALVMLSMGHPAAASRDAIVGSLLKLRESAGHLREGGPVLGSLGGLESEIAWGLLSTGKIEEAKKLLKMAIEDLQVCLQENPDDRRLRDHLTKAYFHSGNIADHEDRSDESVESYERAAEILLRSGSDWWVIDGFYNVFLKIFLIFERMYSMEQTGRAERPWRTCERILNRLKSIAEEAPEDRHIQGCLAIVLSHSVDNPFSPSYTPTRALKYEEDPEAWAVATVSGIHERCSAIGSGDERLGIGYVLPLLIGSASLKASYERRSGRMADAHRTAGMLLAIARRLVEDFPDREDTHIILSEAYTQIAKNAWRGDDPEAIVQAMEKALGAARDALRLGPSREDARQLVLKLSERLESLKEDARQTEPR